MVDAVLAPPLLADASSSYESSLQVIAFNQIILFPTRCCCLVVIVVVVSAFPLLLSSLSKVELLLSSPPLVTKILQEYGPFPAIGCSYRIGGIPIW